MATFGKAPDRIERVEAYHSTLHHIKHGLNWALHVLYQRLGNEIRNPIQFYHKETPAKHVTTFP